MSSQFSSAVNEKDVENLYRHSFMTKFKDMEITSPFGCDGFGVSKSEKLRVLFEFKDETDLSNKVELSKVLSQSIYYVKKFYDSGIIPPSTVFIGDRKQCVALHVNDIISYLDMDLDWGVAPSSAHRNVSLMTNLVQDENIKPFVFNVNDLEDCISKVKDLTDNIQRKVLVTEKNITEVFRYFEDKVLDKSKLSTNEKANLFVQVLVNKDDNYLHPVKKRKTIVTKSFGEVMVVSREGFESFFGHFSSSYSPSQKHKLAAVVDRLVEDSTRRKQGEFFTPSMWVDVAHNYIEKVFGIDWKEKYVVWDPAWGTGNLTRDYKFDNLFVSTLNQSDIETANQMGYNPEATKFQFDFLNDDISNLPQKLQEHLELGSEIILLMNPPYATSNVAGNKGLEKRGTSQTMINETMKSEGIWGKSAQQLYGQFLYRAHKMGLNVCLFSKPNFLTGSSFQQFRNEFFKKYDFRDGFVMDASEFADVESWPLTFTIFKTK